MSEPDVRWQQRFSNYCRALEQLEGFFEPPKLNARLEQGLIEALERWVCPCQNPQQLYPGCLHTDNIGAMLREI